MTGQRSDARRNRAHILAVAEAEVAARGAAASLERIARTAGVGSATVRRHFPTRKALLEAVFQQRVHDLCERARALGDEPDSRSALVGWLRELLAYALAARGLADVLSYEPLQDGAAQDSCAPAIGAAAAPLLRKAVDDGTVRADVTIDDLLVLVVGIALATEDYADPAARADRAFRLAVAGLDAPGT
ncbi:MULTISPECIES: TetR/AcrR family transcriptional regulator [Kitasatospora]|uniref:Putative TetR family transcriptional regulator n=1 Tax=Kitasatospora setae (strain ATCC 33774 / DSM 43861 / JCM 3304 / KCC A-0304 / NBRC 14216 / KM-6054) TaxID=452652 RepID=E4N336_KITSK|nr:MULTISPECIES: TetR/AcrR family transcriptional regulator [Kitasatospora]BAJ32570.1 putative TetR family transcriptional regulator [Kitasatospora setae KM-6054]